MFLNPSKRLILILSVLMTTMLLISACSNSDNPDSTSNSAKNSLKSTKKYRKLIVQKLFQKNQMLMDQIKSKTT